MATAPAPVPVDEDEEAGEEQEGEEQEEQEEQDEQDEEEEQEEEEEDATSSAPTGDRACRGPSSLNEDDRKVEVAELLARAEATSLAASELGQGSLSKDGNRYKCKDCGKRGRRDRLMSHIVYKHLSLKTWVCPLW